MLTYNSDKPHAEVFWYVARACLSNAYAVEANIW